MHISPMRPCKICFQLPPYLILTNYNAAKHTPTNICLSPASRPVRSIWTRWSPEWGWAACGSGPSPEKPANSKKHIQASQFIFRHQHLPEDCFYLVLSCFSRHLPGVPKRHSHETVSLIHLFAPSVFLLYNYVSAGSKNTFLVVKTG